MNSKVPVNAVPALTTEARPRVEGDRELEILGAALDVLADVGYDRLTMDAVAARARASKATLYRRWNTKAALVVDAICAQKEPVQQPDTGTLRGDLIASSCGHGGFTDTKAIGVLGALVTAIHRDADFAAAYRRDFLEPKVEAARLMYQRARDRGEIREDLDLDLITPALAGIILHRVFVLGETTTTDDITRIIDQIILPACTPHTPTPQP